MVKVTRSAGLMFEDLVRRSLKTIGFKDVNGGPDYRVGNYQIDSCGGWDDVLLVAECTQSSVSGASIHDLISEVRGKQPAIKKAFRKLLKYEHYRRFEFAIITRNIKYSQGDREIASEKPRVHLIEFQTLEYYQRLAQLIGRRPALFNFLGELQVEPREFDLPRVPALKVRLTKDYRGYLFWCEPQELLRVAYVARRESGREKYYQRMLSASRLKTIRKFIAGGGVFPNNVIVCFDRKPEFRPKLTYESGWPSWLEFGELIFPRSYRSCWIIDGQHRLYGFKDLVPNPKAQKLAVFAFEHLPEHRQARFFIEINREQKQVSLDLIWDLEGEMSPLTPAGRIANCVKKLNTLVPAKDTIFLPLSGEHKRGQLKMSGVCYDFEETCLLEPEMRVSKQVKQINPLVHGSDVGNAPDRVASEVARFLNAVRKQVPEDLWNGILLRPGGMTLMLHVYQQILACLKHRPSDEEVTKYANPFAAVLADLAPNKTTIRSLRRELTSYAQRREMLNYVLSEMQEILRDSEFAKIPLPASEKFERLIRFERNLAKFVAEYLGLATISDLSEKASEGLWRRVEKIMQKQQKVNPDVPLHEALGLGDIREIMTRKDSAKVLMPILTQPGVGFRSEQAVLVALDEIVEARNPKFHGRTGSRTKMVAVFLEIFERLMGT